MGELVLHTPDGVEIFVRTTAPTGRPSRAPVVLLHGLTDDSACLGALARDLAGRGHPVWAPDAPGHGRSGLPVRFDTAAREAAALVVARRVATEAGPPVLVGHSMGAETAAVVAAGHPDLVRAVVVEDPPWTLPGDEARTEGSAPQRVEEWLAGLRDAGDEGRLAAARAEGDWDPVEWRPWADAKAAVHPELFHRPQGWLGSGSPDGGWPGLVARIRVPALLVTGDPDDGAIVTPGVAARFAAVTPAGRTVRIEGAGHCVRRDRPARFAEAVHGFLAGLDLEAEQRRLAARLGGWAAASVLGGAVLAVVGARSGRSRPALVAFGRQSAAWGAADGAIAAAGEWRRRSRPLDLADPDAVEAGRARLRRLLLVNAVLDVGYVAGGAVLALGSTRVAARTRGRRDAAAVRGDGLAVVVQGGFLLWLDVTAVRRLGRLSGH